MPEVKRFRKKPVIIEAFQWKKEMGEVGPVFFDKVYRGFIIDTLEGPHRVTDGDWVIKGVAGEFYPCKPGIFESTYEPAGE